MVVGAKIETAARVNGPSASSSTLSTLSRASSDLLLQEIISGSLSRCSPPRYKSPCGHNVNLRIVRFVGELPRSYRDEMIL